MIELNTLIDRNKIKLGYIAFTILHYMKAIISIIIYGLVLRRFNMVKASQSVLQFNLEMKRTKTKSLITTLHTSTEYTKIIGHPIEIE